MTVALELSEDEAHLWYVRSDEVHDPRLLERYRALLAPDEARQHLRFVFPEGRHEYLLTRALVRTVLSRYAPEVAPEAWIFTRTAHGRPEIAGPAGAPAFRFNLSNTRGLIACLVASGHEVGVDVEDTSRAGETVEIAEHYFSPSEAAALRSLPAERQRARFFEYWTLKESYIKARGLGLAIPLDQFSFELGGPEIRISFDPRLADDPSIWQFSLLRPTERHAMAAALRGDPRRVAIDLRETVPLA